MFINWPAQRRRPTTAQEALGRFDITVPSQSSGRSTGVRRHRPGARRRRRRCKGRSSWTSRRPRSPHTRSMPSSRSSERRGATGPASSTSRTGSTRSSAGGSDDRASRRRLPGNRQREGHRSLRTRANDRRRRHVGSQPGRRLRPQLDGGEPIRLAGVHNEQVALRVRNLVAQRLEGIDFDSSSGEIVGRRRPHRVWARGAGRGTRRRASEPRRPREHRRPAEVRPDTAPSKGLGRGARATEPGVGAAILEFTMRENISLPSLDRDSSLGFSAGRPRRATSQHWIEAPRHPSPRPRAALRAAERRKPAEGRLRQVA